MTPERDDTPPCGHESCLFEPVCIVVAATVEPEAHRTDVEHRRRRGIELAERVGVPSLARAFEALAYDEREAAGRVIVAALHDPAATTEAA